MENKDIKSYFEEYAIEEKIPYFGKARLYTISFSESNQKFYIPREIFHFMTAIYLLNGKPEDKYQIHINSYHRNIASDEFSDINRETQERKNILQDPVFLGKNTQIYIQNTGKSEPINILVEYGKISPDLYEQLHQNNIVLLSKQKNNFILHQFRGNAP